MQGAFQDLLFVAVVAVLFIGLFKYAQPFERWLQERRRRRSQRV